MMYIASAKIITPRKSQNVESGAWESKEKAYAELRYFVTQAMPMRGSFKVVQSIKRI